MPGYLSELIDGSITIAMRRQPRRRVGVRTWRCRSDKVTDCPTATVTFHLGAMLAMVTGVAFAFEWPTHACCLATGLKTVLLGEQSRQ